MNRNRSWRGTAVLLTAVTLALPGALPAATPSSGTVSQSSPEVAWTGGPLLPTASADCGGPASSQCDNFRLTIAAPASAFSVEVAVTPALVDDYDLQVYAPDGTLAGSSGNSPGQPETVVLTNPAPGTYTVAVAPYAATSAYAATAVLALGEEPPPPPTDTPPRYATHVAPDGMGRGAGEPTLGVNEAKGTVMYIAGLETLKVRFDECTSPAAADWQDVSFLTTSQVTFDPILWTDQQTGRTFVSQLLFPAKVSLMAFTDDDGASWTPSQGAGINSGLDHQAVGGGPWAGGSLGPVLSYPHAVYYCSQDVALAQCATSYDGGLTFGPAVPIYDLTECGGLHGHPKVAPDGTVYMPNKGCGGEQAVVVSADSGLTWEVRRVAGSTAGAWDPSVGVASDGTVYFGYGNGDGHPYVAVSHDRGETWEHVQDVGTAFGIENVAFPAMVAGDPDRAAFAFLGTTATGNATGEDPTFPGEWHLYVAHTYDGGQTWVTSDATPDDAVQRGTICAGGISCGGTRNLLDFMDATIDAEGRVLVAYADGCIGGCVGGPPNSATAVATIARQLTGKRMYAAGDPVDGPPDAPALAAVLEEGGVRLTWSVPAENGSPITGYRLYRRTGSTQHELLATFGPETLEHLDATVDPAAAGDVFYRVSAENAAGESASCRDVAPVVPEFGPRDSCQPPGIRVARDAEGDGVPAALDALELSVAEPVAMDGSSPVVFTLKVADLSNFTVGNAWVILWNRPQPDAEADRNYVAMRATGPGQASFEYGRISPPNVNQAVAVGAADFGTFDIDGTITIGISPDKIDGVGPGQDLAGLEVRTFVVNASGMPVTQLSAADFTPAGLYGLRGNAHCAVNNPPEALADAVTTLENRPVKITVLANDSDPDGDPLEVVAIGTPAHGRLIATQKSGVATYKPNAGFSGTDGFTYTIEDGRGGSATATVTVTVEPK